MSDFEDEMDVDVPAPKSAIQFSSDNASKRAKRPAADLPVEAQDNLPWSVLGVHISDYIAN
jgi:replication factor C subunit 3/5